MDSQVEAHFWRSYWMRTRRLKRLCYTSIQALLYRHLHALWLLRAAPPVVNTQPVVSAAACVVLGAFGGALSERISGDTKNPRFEEPGIIGAPEGIRTPNLLIRSQMLYPLSYRRMFLALDFFNPSRQQVLLYGCPRGCASRKTRNLPKIPSKRLSNTPFCRMIPGVLCS